MSEENTGSGVSFIKGLLFGGFIGAGLALLYAPKTGKELREELKEKSGELKSEAEKYYAEAKDISSDLLVDGLKKAEQLKKDAEVAFEEAKKKFEEMLTESKRLADEVKEKADEKLAVAQDKIDLGKKTVTEKTGKLKQAIKSGKEAFHKEKKTAKSKKA
ncbi:YtxH domain-containing protein [candidate division KSB1 bacterium]|nr:YtxH domain-containing protein [candidate division KSB1 bacterium]